MDTNEDSLPVSLENFLAEILPDIDSALAKNSVPLQQRIYRATIIFIEHCLVSIEGDSIDNYHNKPWFKTFFEAIYAWYEKRYGNTLFLCSESTLTGVISIFDTPFLAKIPLTIKESSDSESTFWICFPIEVFPTENYLDWVEQPPNFDSLTILEKKQLSSDIVTIASELRRIYVNFMTATYQNERLGKLAQCVLPNLEKGAAEVAKCNPISLSMSIWDLNLACEMILKVMLLQRSIDPPKIHDVHKLHQMIASATSIELSNLDKFVSLLPSEKIAIRHRYSETSPPSLQDAMSIYRAALSIVSGYSHCLQRKYTFNNARFKFKPLFQ